MSNKTQRRTLIASTALALALAMTSASAQVVPPSQIQTTVDGVNWTGDHTVTGAQLNTIFNQVIQTFLTWAAPLNSPSFTGTVTIPVGAALNTPASLTLTHATGLPASTGIADIGAGVAKLIQSASLANCSNIIAYGGSPTLSDNTAAFTAARASFGATGGCVYFPAGKYTFTSQQSYSFTTSPSSITIEGDGADNTILFWPSASGGSGISLTLANAEQSFHIKDLTFDTGVSSGGTALTVATTSPSVTANSDVSNVTFRGDDFGLTPGVNDYWTADANIILTNNVGFYNDLFIGANGSGGSPVAGIGEGVLIAGSSSFFAFNYNFVADTFLNLSVGLNVGNYAQGFAVVNSSFGGVQGIAFNGTAGIECCVNIVGTEFNTSVSGVVVANEPMFEMYFSADTFFVSGPSGFGILLNDNGGSTIVGNNFQPNGPSGTTGTTGIAIGTTSANFATTISANTFVDIATGITLTSAASNVNIQGNAFTQITNTAISNSATTGIIIQNNLGYNPVGVTGPTNVPTSPATICAGPAPETHYYLQSATNTATIKLTNTSGPLIGTMSSATIPVVTNLGPNECEFVTWATTDPTYTKSIH